MTATDATQDEDSEIADDAIPPTEHLLTIRSFTGSSDGQTSAQLDLFFDQVDGATIGDTFEWRIGPHAAIQFSRELLHPLARLMLQHCTQAEVEAILREIQTEGCSP